LKDGRGIDWGVTAELGDAETLRIYDLEIVDDSWRILLMRLGAFPLAIVAVDRKKCVASQ
jgi:hypothetical protein